MQPQAFTREQAIKDNARIDLDRVYDLLDEYRRNPTEDGHDASLLFDEVLNIVRRVQADITTI